MNKKMVFNFLGQIVRIGSAMLLLPLITAFCYGEWYEALAFGAVIVLTLGLGQGLTMVFRPENKTIYAKEGFVIVASSWILLSLLGALPFVITGAIPNYFDAFFETVSGFTTTGASILTDIEGMSRSMLFWRSFTHWVGGMGVLVFVMAIVPSISDRSIHILKAEMPGPVVGKLVPKVRQTARILYLIYIGMTVLEVVLLLCGGMPFFDSLVHTFGTAGTGGFGIKANSIAGYSHFCQWVITVFMLLFGVNFNIYYLLLIRRFRSALRSTELWVYLGIAFVSTAIVAFNVFSLYDGSVADTLRDSSFQVASVMTTTGFSTTDFDKWPELSKAILLTLMFTGACAGSTGGGLKVSRVVMLFKMMGRELRKMLHPRAVESVRYEGKKLEEATLHSTASYFALYVVLFVAIFLLISFDSFGFVENFSAVAACYNNIGPGFGRIGPTGSYAGYSAFSKVLLSLAMLFGRLEIYPLLFAFSPSTWFKK